jgi:16S rRNA (adenine1518-N6/adenine1519-N6)-dimethyltransferase
VGQRLGQHFLVKGSILERIAAAACPDHVELVIEIGPGRGALTEKLLQRADRVVAIELDESLVGHLRARFPDRLEVIHSDVLDVDLGQWGRVPVVGNLPYYITSPILDKVGPVDYLRAVFLMQKEVAERLVASPKTREYGFLTVKTAIFAQKKLLFDVKPGAFQPPPKVDSSVVLLERRPPVVDDPDRFLRFASACFRQKRKMLRNNLSGHYDRSILDKMSESGLRAEQLSVEQLVDLYGRLTAQSQA